MNVKLRLRKIQFRLVNLRIWKRKWKLGMEENGLWEVIASKYGSWRSLDGASKFFFGKTIG